MDSIAYREIPGNTKGKHEYVAVSEWDYPLRRCYELVCRKCGKEKEITIYNRGVKHET